MIENSKINIIEINNFHKIFHNDVQIQYDKKIFINADIFQLKNV